MRVDDFDFWRAAGVHLGFHDRPRPRRSINAQAVVAAYRLDRGLVGFKPAKTPPVPGERFVNLAAIKKKANDLVRPGAINSNCAGSFPQIISIHGAPAVQASDAGGSVPATHPRH